MKEKETTDHISDLDLSLEPHSSGFGHTHDRVALFYDQLTDLISFLEVPKTKDHVLSILRPDRTILEVGCGNGRFSVACAKRANHIVSVDLSSTMIANAQSLARKENIQNIEFHAMNFLEYNTDELFDYVIIPYLCNVLPDENHVSHLLRHALQFLRPGGEIIIVDEMEPSHWFLRRMIHAARIPVIAFFKITTHIKFHPIHDLEMILTSLDLEIIEKKQFLFQYCSVLRGRMIHA